MKRIATGARAFAARCLRPLMRRAARAYIAGDTLDEAMHVADTLMGEGLGATIGFWDSPENSPRAVAYEYVQGVRALAGHEHAYLSIKTPALGFSRELLAEVIDEARRHRVRVHFDSLAPEEADRNRALCEEFLETGAELSYTLPGRWERSIRDAAWAAERGITVRVVKGQWADPIDPHRDLRQGFLDVIDALAGKARHVEVASHDAPLVAEAVRRLRDAETSCGVELLYGLPMRESLRQAGWLALGVHIYVPYGKSYLPYALSRVRSNPRMAWWLLRDVVAAMKPVRLNELREHEAVAH